MKRKGLTLLTALTLTMGLVGCSPEEETTGSENPVETVTVKHYLGETEVEVNPERIVVAGYWNLDNLDALGVDGIVGVPKSDAFPPNLDKYLSDEYANIGSTTELDIEEINALDPDIIIVSDYNKDIYEDLQTIAPTVALSTRNDADYMVSLKNNLDIIGDIFDISDEEINEKYQPLEDRIDELKAEIQKEDLTATTMTIQSDSTMSVIGDHISLLYNNLGFREIDETFTPEKRGSQITFEYLVEKNPDYIFAINRSATSSENPVDPAEIIANELIKDIDAVKNENFVVLDLYDWYMANGGLTSTSKALDQMEEFLK